MLVFLGLRSKVDFAAESALSLFLAPMWLGIQHMIFCLWHHIESSLLSSLMIKGSQVSYFLTMVIRRASQRIWFAIFVLWYYTKSKVNGTDFCRKNGAFLRIEMVDSCLSYRISAMWSANEFVLELNSGGRFHCLWL